MAQTIYNSQEEALPTEIAALAIQRKTEKPNYSAAHGLQGEDHLNYMFNWGGTIEKHAFWSKINAGYFDVFYKRYPKSKKIDDYSII